MTQSESKKDVVEGLLRTIWETQYSVGISLCKNIQTVVKRCGKFCYSILKDGEKKTVQEYQNLFLQDQITNNIVFDVV